jgi:BD-FAE
MTAAIRVLLPVFLLATIASAQGRVEKDIVCGMYSGTALLMDVHYPENANGIGVVFVPGSAWSADTAYGAAGIKDGEIPRIWVPPLTGGAGYTVFVPNHRATPAFHYPDPVHDIQRAVRFVRHPAQHDSRIVRRSGGLYIDGDGNGRFTRDSDYAFWAVYESPEAGQPCKAFYGSAVVREARARRLFGPTWPSHIATPEQVEQRARTEDALRHVPDRCATLAAPRRHGVRVRSRSCRCVCRPSSRDRSGERVVECAGALGSIPA